MAGARGDIMAGRSYVELYVRNNQFIRGLRDARQRLSQFGADITALGRTMVAASAGMLIPVAFATRTFASFDDAMRQVLAVTTQGTKSFAQLTETAKELGRTTSFTATEVASLMAELGRAGFNTDQVDAMTGSVLALARATSTDATLASGIMAASIRQFGLAAGDAGRVADGLTAAANKSFNTVEQLGEALSYAGPVARDFNVSFEDTLAILGGLGNVGIQASNAGTAVRRLLTLSAAEAEKLKGIFGVAFRDSAGNARPLVDVLGEVNEATKNLGTAARAEKFNEAFGLLGITGASAIGRSAGDIRQLAVDIKAATGIATESAAAMDAGLGGAFRIFMSALEGVQIAIGEAIAEPLANLTGSLTEVLGVITRIVGENRSAVVAFAKWGLAIGAAGVALLGVGLAATIASTAIGGLVGMVGLVSTVMGIAAGVGASLFAVLTSPVSLAVVAIAGISAALVQATGSMNGLVASGMNATASLSKIFGDLKTSVMASFRGIVDAIGVGNFRLAGQIAVTSLRLIFLQGFTAISSMIGGIMGETMAKFVVQISGGNFSGAWQTVVATMSAMWATFSNGVVSMFTSAASAVLGAWKSAIDGIANYFLKKASENAVFNAAFKVATGIDVQKEVERNARLNQTLGLGADRTSGDIFDQVGSGNFQGSTIADPFIAAQQNALDAIADQAQRNADEAGEALEAAAGGGVGAASAEMLRLQKELAEFQQQAKDARERADAVPTDAAGIAGAAGAGGGGGGGARSASIATENFQGFLAQIQGSRGDSQETKEIRTLRQVAKEGFDGMIETIHATALHHA